MPSRFFSLHRQGMVRVAACTPRIAVGDPARNAAETLELLHEGKERGVDLMLFPELGLSAYAIDDLFLQDALLDGVERAVAQIWRRRRGTCRACSSSARRCAATSASTTARSSSRAAASWAWCRRHSCPTTASTTRTAGSRPASASPDARCRSPGQVAPFGTDLVFAATGLADFVFHVEICEDFWAPAPPSTQGALAGATILCNLSASNIVVGKAAERAVLCASQSMRCQAAYVYSAAGPGESTTDLAWDGPGDRSTSWARCSRAPSGSRRRAQMAVADVDVAAHPPRAAAHADLQRRRHGRPAIPRRRSAACAFEHRRARPRCGPRAPASTASRSCPTIRPRLDQDCYEAFNIQVAGPGASGSQSTKGERMVIGVSGGLDSTHALIVAAKAVRRAGPAAREHPGLHHAGLRHRRGDEGQRLGADEARSASTGEEIDIRPAARQMLADIGPSVRAAASRSTTSPSRTCRRACAPTTSSGSPTSAAAS